jgi:hypothetical protein
VLARYPARASYVWRWIDCPADALVSAFVATFVRADEATRREMRAGLDPADLVTMAVFAQRRAFAAIRSVDAGAAIEAFDALSVIDLDRVGEPEVALPLSLAAYAAVTAGMPLDAAAAEAISRADARMAQLLSDTVTSGVTDLVATCRLQVVQTPDGPALFVAGNQRSYRPTRDLVPIATAIASTIDHDPNCDVTSIALGWHFPAPDTTADLRLTEAIKGLVAVAAVHATTAPGPGRKLQLNSCEVFLAEAATVEDASLIAASTVNDARPSRIGVASERLLALLQASSVPRDAKVDIQSSIGRFVPAIQALLLDNGDPPT